MSDNRCEVCGSDDPKRCRHSKFLCQHVHEVGCCPDKFHAAAQEPYLCECGHTDTSHVTADGACACGCKRLSPDVADEPTHPDAGGLERARPEPHPLLMAAALSHRDEYPWRYYKFERDDLMRMLDGMVAEVAAAKRALFDEHEATCGHSTECWMCCHKERP